MSSQPVRLASVFLHFLQLGCTAFGGPVAHLGYFQETFVQKLRWIRQDAYGDLVALCQFLPGPASSQVAFSIGYHQRGVIGAFLAWFGFTLPSAVIMIAFALGLTALGDLQDAGWITGLKLAAVAVVANAIWTMAEKLCPDRGRALLAISSATLLLIFQETHWQILVLLMGAGIGWRCFGPKIAAKEVQPNSSQPQRSFAWLYLFAFGVLLIVWPLAGQRLGGWLEASEGFYRAGSLVFGGGHVLLPLLDGLTVAKGWVDSHTFLAGYGAAQALPGPLFAFAGFLGATMQAGPGGLTGGLLAMFAINLPSWLLVLGVLPYWERLKEVRAARAALMGTNAAVVGLLLAAFYDPIWSSAITDPHRFAFALLAFALLRFASLPPWLLVIVSALVGALLWGI